MRVAGEVLGGEPGQVRGRGALQGGAEPGVVDGGADQLGPRGREGQDLGRAAGRRSSTSTPRVGQRLGERVVLLLRAGHPRDAVEEQLVVVARA